MALFLWQLLTADMSLTLPVLLQGFVATPGHMELKQSHPHGKVEKYSVS
jgi:hypothetical protein